MEYGRFRAHDSKSCCSSRIQDISSGMMRSHSRNRSRLTRAVSPVDFRGDRVTSSVGFGHTLVTVSVYITLVCYDGYTV